MPVTTAQLNAEIAARKAADIANAAAISAEGKARLAGDKLNADAIAGLAARVAKLEESVGNVILRVACRTPRRRSWRRDRRTMPVARIHRQ